MTNKQYLKCEDNDERLKLFLYFSRQELQSMKRIKAFLNSDISAEKINMVKLYCKE